MMRNNNNQPSHDDRLQRCLLDLQCFAIGIGKRHGPGFQNPLKELLSADLKYLLIQLSDETGGPANEVVLNEEINVRIRSSMRVENGNSFERSLEVISEYHNDMVVCANYRIAEFGFRP